MICPKCGKKCEADFVDNGVGMQQCGPYVCLPDYGGCGWSQDDGDNIIQQPLSGSPEGSPKSAEPTSDNGKRCTQSPFLRRTNER